MTKEEEVLQWLILQKNEATIEEVTDEMLDDLISKYEYVAVLFSKRLIHSGHLYKLAGGLISCEKLFAKKLQYLI